jgi:predicted nuclease with TOPRIM domain
MERRRMPKTEHFDDYHTARILQRQIHTAVCEAGLPTLQTIEVLSDYLNANVRGFNDYLAEQTTRKRK